MRRLFFSRVTFLVYLFLRSALCAFPTNVGGCCFGIGSISGVSICTLRISVYSLLYDSSLKQRNQNRLYTYAFFRSRFLTKRNLILPAALLVSLKLLLFLNLIFFSTFLRCDVYDTRGGNRSGSPFTIFYSVPVWFLQY